jgi:hypothetical protein
MRKIRLKWLAGLLSATLIITALAGCGSVSSLERPMPTAGATTYTVTGSCTISKSGDVVTVSGATDAMNGALIDVSVVAQNGIVIDHTAIQKTGDEISAQFTVTDEKYGDVVDMKGYITIAPLYYGKQSDEVYATYGKKFENITNDTDTAIWNNEGVILVFASEWLNGVVPITTPGPAPSPTATPEATPTVSAEASATPSA